jgi:putative hydrolase of the HAD superfamily
LRALGIDDDALADELYETFSDMSSYKLFDDVLPALGDIKSRGYRVGLISNFERWLEQMLVELEVGHLFELAVISGVEGVEKPDAGIYNLALERARLDPVEAVHVGDSPTLDVEPARRVGMHAVLLDRVDRYGSFDGARIRSLEELPDLLEAL